MGEFRRRHRRHRFIEPATVATQRSGRVLGRFFEKLRHRRIAERFNWAVRCHNAREIERLLGRHCRVECFFRCGCKSCVRIRCCFGRWGSNETTITICVEDFRRNF